MRRQKYLLARVAGGDFFDKKRSIRLQKLKNAFTKLLWAGLIAAAQARGGHLGRRPPRPAKADG